MRHERADMVELETAVRCAPRVASGSAGEAADLARQRGGAHAWAKKRCEASRSGEVDPSLLSLPSLAAGELASRSAAAMLLPMITCCAASLALLAPPSRRGRRRRQRCGATATRSSSCCRAAAPPPPSCAPPSPPPAFPAWLLVTVVFMHVLASAVIAQAAGGAALGLGNDRVRTARLLGQLSSLAALLDIVVTPQLGRLSDTIGRRPLLLAALCVALVVAASQQPAAGGGARLSETALRHRLLHLHGLAPRRRRHVQVRRANQIGAIRRNSAPQFSEAARTILSGTTPNASRRLGLMSAASGAAYALGMLIGGHLVARALWLPYAPRPCSSSRASAVVPLRRDSAKDRRATFGWQLPAVSFLRLFGRAARSRLSSVHALQTLSMSMGDTWQARTSRAQSFGAQFGDN